MPIQEIFPTYLFTETNIPLAKKLLPLCNHYTSISKSNCLNIENFPSTLHDYRDEVNNHPVVQETLEYIINNYLTEYLRYRGIYMHPNTLKPFSFFSSMNKGAYLRKHSHLDCLFSGLIYLEVGNDVPPITLYDPKPVRSFINYSISPDSKDMPIHVIYPEVGKVLMWDAHLEHEVCQKLNDEPRKTFVFNF